MSLCVHVCETCRKRDLARGEADIVPALAAMLDDVTEAAFELVPQSCLGMCAPGANLAVTGPGRWGWLFRELRPGEELAAFAVFLRAWLAHPEGLPPKSARPACLRPCTVGRLPPR